MVKGNGVFAAFNIVVLGQDKDGQKGKYPFRIGIFSFKPTSKA
jgi:hypothetical protein